MSLKYSYTTADYLAWNEIAYSGAYPFTFWQHIKA